MYECTFRGTCGTVDEINRFALCRFTHKLSILLFAVGSSNILGKY